LFIQYVTIERRVVNDMSEELLMCDEWRVVNVIRHVPHMNGGVQLVLRTESHPTGE